jgi:hypothetical protein
MLALCQFCWRITKYVIVYDQNICRILVISEYSGWTAFFLCLLIIINKLKGLFIE